MKRRTKTDGGLCFESSRNKWRATLTTPAGEKIVKRFVEREAAAVWLAEQKAAIYKGDFCEPSKLTFAAWAENYIKTYCGHLRPNSLKDTLNMLAKFEPLFNIELQKLHPLKIQNIVNAMPNAAATKIKALQLIKRMLKKAYILGIMGKDITPALTMPQRQAVPVEILTESEIKNILSFCENSRYYRRYYNFIYLALATGARMGELLALTWADIGDGLIYINKSACYVYGVMQITAPKTSAGVRRVSVPSSVTALLWPQGDESPAPGAFVFATKNGTPWPQNNIERAWRAILKEASVPPRHFHALRHFHASALLAAGVNIATISARLGHAKITTTLNIYTRAMPQAENDINDKIAAIINA